MTTPKQAYELYKTFVQETDIKDYGELFNSDGFTFVWSFLKMKLPQSEVEIVELIHKNKLPIDFKITKMVKLQYQVAIYRCRELDSFISRVLYNAALNGFKQPVSKSEIRFMETMKELEAV